MLLVNDVSDISIERDFKVVLLKEGIGKADRTWCNDVRPFIRHGEREETFITNLRMFIYNLDNPYNPSISFLYFWYTSLRRTFKVGVSVLSSTLKGSRLR